MTPNDPQTKSTGNGSALFPGLDEQKATPAGQPTATPPAPSPEATPAAAPAQANIAQQIAQKHVDEKAQASAAATQQRDELKILQQSIISGNIPQLVTSSMTHALNVRASDIHIEPERNTVRVRYRIDGVLRQVVEYPTNIHPAVVSRIKIMSNLKIDEQRIPQDGRAQVTTPSGDELDLRVSTMPTVNGEKVVMRLQERTRKIPALSELGVTGLALKNLKKALELPNGIILTSGPTGSGKTTTLYSALQILNKIDVNILTFEDPVEIQMDGLNQSQVHPDIEYDFARGLRAALRQDPDIMMVGEIRDRETIDVAIESALTGHLVLSTIHTNSAVETLTRILNMKVPPFLLTSTINLIIAQRLVRQLCQDCKKPTQPDEPTMLMVKKAIDRLSDGEKNEYETGFFDNLTFYAPAGCDKCDNIGYHGRAGLYEVLSMNNDIRMLILEKASTMDIEAAALKSGMTTLEQSGIIKALQGVTTLSEVYRVARPME